MIEIDVIAYGVASGLLASSIEENGPRKLRWWIANISILAIIYILKAS